MSLSKVFTEFMNNNSMYKSLFLTLKVKHIPDAYSYERVHSVFSTSVQIAWEQ